MREPIQALEKLRFAKVATVQWIAGVVRIGEFVGPDHFDARADPFRHRERIPQGEAGQARAVRDHSHGAIA